MCWESDLGTHASGVLVFGKHARGVRTKKESGVANNYAAPLFEKPRCSA